MCCVDIFDCLACLIMPFRGSKREENEVRFLCFFLLENAMNLFSPPTALSKFIKIAGVFAFLDKLAKCACCAKRVHLLRMNTHPPIEIPVAKRG